MRYVLKSKTAPGWYLCPGKDMGLTVPQWVGRKDARVFDSIEKARAFRDECLGAPNADEYRDTIIVRLLSLAESKERARQHGIRQALSLVRSHDWQELSRDEIVVVLGQLLCPCKGELEDPGPTHIDGCPFSDPEYGEAAF